MRNILTSVTSFIKTIEMKNVTVRMAVWLFLPPPPQKKYYKLSMLSTLFSFDALCLRKKSFNYRDHESFNMINSWVINHERNCSLS